MEGFALNGGRNPKGVPLITAVGVADEIRTDAAQIGVSGLAILIQPNKNRIVVWFAFIEPPGLNTETDKLLVDSAPSQIAFYLVTVLTGFGEQQYLCFSCFALDTKTGG